MKIRSFFLVAAVLLATSACSSLNDTPQAVKPEPRSTEYPWMSIERWYQMHAEDVGIAAKGEARLVLVGDSITEGWPDHLLENYFGQYQPANFGIGGDRTENLLWRLQNSSVGELEPEVVILLIGVNNFGLRGDNPEEVAAGVKAVVKQLRQSFPQAKIVLHGIFPYKQFADSPEREAVRQVNREIAQLADGERIFYLDIGEKLTQENGDISPAIMPDFLHLSEQGYVVWGEALAPVVKRLMKNAQSDESQP